jgi:UDP-N-acetyl-D-mannosaminuronate dehydrogenase
VAYDKADIIAFLVNHKEFKNLEFRNDKIILDFAGVFNSQNFDHSLAYNMENAFITNSVF